MGQLARQDGGARAHVEMRDEARRAVASAPLGRMYVKARHELQPVLSIRDLSQRGVCLCLEHRLVAGEPVVIELRRGDAHLEFYAYVAWCQARAEDDESAGQHLVGLRVYGAHSLGQLIAH